MGEKYRAELLAPAGSLSVCKAAVFAGADAVYMGGQKYSARAFAKSSVSEEDELLLAIEFCHLYGVKLFMTVNTLFKESELEKLPEYMDPYVEAGVDAVIVQDLGVAKVLKEAYPDLPLHASTQMTANTREAVSLLSSFGMERIVLSRELSLKDISDIYENTGAELEVFVHGAMCYSYSGACFMSSLLGGRSGNRGRCAGTCRLPYTTGGKKGNFLSMKDMNTRIRISSCSKDSSKTAPLSTLSSIDRGSFLSRSSIDFRRKAVSSSSSLRKGRSARAIMSFALC